MLQGFKDFIMRGNIVDLAVAVVIGTAFAKVVEVVVGSIITPLLNAMGGAEASGLGFRIISTNPGTYVDFAAVINALIVFLMTALVVYYVIVVPMNKVNDKMGFGAEEDAAPAEDVALLTEIRDLLARRNV
ncbi:large conductance mechanosensitive channel protein MscL [Ornithinimicrobium sp. F0845]|uniref:large conductance mechanosensitive channel protein MscL n=1 Tax=Ornithinimicrobium sp. F0845 TaxID=2926412 RepID=UPI001FF6BC2A|nr:large conductance mechanosensitive channel protein MscL [Ornithinimicrobium sp. F0845]MCK0113927.1 large conductance mechanosensitive channel protein MscL [Ornithinimicrobium sp. F0845]